MPYTDSLCPDCLRAVQSGTGHPSEDSLVLLGIDTVERAGQAPVTSRHYACIRCTATWKATPVGTGLGMDHGNVDWQMIDSPS